MSETALVTIQQTQVLEVFTTGTIIDPILEEITKQAKGFEPDLTTAKGRKEIASMAHKVAQSKTYLDGIGKTLTDEYKEIPKKIDANRKKIRDYLDKLKDDVRKPLTEWEDAESARVQEIKDRIETIRQHSGMSEDSTMTRSAIARLESISIDETFAEFSVEASQAKDKALTILRADLDYCLKREAEQAELARLRAENAKREQEERERKIAEEAAEKARREAEAKAESERKNAEEKAKREREELERREVEAKLALERAERERVEAIERAAREKQAAIDEERRRVEDEKREREAEEKRRSEDECRRNFVHNMIVKDLCEQGVQEDLAKNIIAAIDMGNIRCLKIEY